MLLLCGVFYEQGRAKVDELFRQEQLGLVRLGPASELRRKAGERDGSFAGSMGAGESGL